MIQCHSCGQANSPESNFCRFCGSAFPRRSNGGDYDFSPPRPYVWKTDEFQISKSRARNTQAFQQVQPLAYQPPAAAHQPAPMPVSTGRQPHPAVHGYHCPRCQSQLAPRIEKRISTAGWIVFAVLLITLFPLFWIGFFLKEEIRVCPVCNLRLN